MNTLNSVRDPHLAFFYSSNKQKFIGFNSDMPVLFDEIGLCPK